VRALWLVSTDRLIDPIAETLIVYRWTENGYFFLIWIVPTGFAVRGGRHRQVRYRFTISPSAS
jgi:hypothetical protein